MEFRPLFSAHPPYFCQFFPPTFFPPTLVSQFFSPTFFPPTLVSQFFSPTFFPPTPCLSVVSGAPPSCSKQMHGYCCLSVVADLVHRDFMSSALNSKCYIALVTCVEHLNGLCILCALQCLFKDSNSKDYFQKRIHVFKFCVILIIFFNLMYSTSLLSKNWSSYGDL